MSNTLRVLLLIAAVFAAVCILQKIRKLKVKMEDAIFWVIFAGVLCLLGVFPELTYWLTERVGILSPANLIFLVMIFLLLEKVFTLSIIVSQLEEKVTVLSAEIALRNHSAERRLKAAEEKTQKDEETEKTDGPEIFKEPEGEAHRKLSEKNENKK